MGFNRRKMEDQRRGAAEKEAAARRATAGATRSRNAERFSSVTVSAVAVTIAGW
jgi:hypothetical protein